MLIDEFVTSEKRKAIESLYSDIVTIIDYKETIDAKTGISRFDKEIIYKDLPCRITQQSSLSANQTETSDDYLKTVIVILAPEIEIKPGCNFILTRQNQTEEYKQAGKRKLYSDHQSVQLEFVKKRA